MTSLIRKRFHSSSFTICVLANVVLGLPGAAAAQQGASGTTNWRIEPIVGAWHQGSANPEAAMQHPREVGPVYGLTLSQQRGAVARVGATVSYHRIDDANQMTIYSPTGESRTYTYDKEILTATTGIAGDLWQGGAAAIAVGFEVGGAWTRDRLDRAVGPSIAPILEPSSDNNWRPAFVAAPSLAARWAVAPRLELTATTRYLISVGDMQPKSAPTLALGTAYRF